MKRPKQGGLLPMLKFREIIRLHELGRSQSEIAQSCAVARSTESRSFSLPRFLN